MSSSGPISHSSSESRDESNGQAPTDEGMVETLNWYQAVQTKSPSSVVALEYLKKKRQIDDVETFLERILHEHVPENVDYLWETISKKITSAIRSLDRPDPDTPQDKRPRTVPASPLTMAVPIQTTSTQEPTKKKDLYFPQGTRLLTSLENDSIDRTFKCITEIYKNGGKSERSLVYNGAILLLPGLMVEMKVIEKIKSLILKILEKTFDAKEGDDFKLKEPDGSVVLNTKLDSVNENFDAEHLAEQLRTLLEQVNIVEKDITALTHLVQLATVTKDCNWETVITVNGNRMSKEAGAADILCKETNHEVKEARKICAHGRGEGQHRATRKRAPRRNSGYSANGHVDNHQRGSGGRGGHQSGYGRGGARAAGGGPGRYAGDGGQ